MKNTTVGLFLGLSFFFRLLSVAKADVAICPAAAAMTLAKATQLVVVTTAGWNSVDAKMRFYSRKSPTTAWVPSAIDGATTQTIAAVIGRNGMGWGKNFSDLHQATEPIKHEGDGRSPAGIHSFAQRFGFAALQNVSPTWHYTALTPSVVCVDDPNSVYYSNIVDSTVVRKDWKSAEEMHSISEYKMGMNINYVTDRKEQTGSCIFFHIWDAPHVGTTGCTAIDESHMSQFQEWLHDDSAAAIAFLTKPSLTRFAGCFTGITF